MYRRAASGLLAAFAGAAVLGVPTLAAASATQLSWQLAKSRCVAGVVHLDVSIDGAVVGQSYAIYGTSGLRASNEEVIAKAASFTATFTPNEAYGSNDASHFSATGDVEAPAIGQRSQVRTISAACAAATRPPATVPSTLSTSLGFDASALGPAPRHHASHTGRTISTVLVVMFVLVVVLLLAWRRWLRPHGE